MVVTDILILTSWNRCKIMSPGINERSLKNSDADTYVMSEAHQQLP